jgi:hypothetical protein
VWGHFWTGWKLYETDILHGMGNEGGGGVNVRKESTRDWERKCQSVISLCFLNASKPSSREGIKNSLSLSLTPGFLSI